MSDPQTGTSQLVPAASLGIDQLCALFNDGFSGYLVPMHMDRASFDAHITGNDVSLDCSRVMVLGRPVAFALIGVRDTDAWVAGMGTSPPHRQRGLGEQTLRAALEAAAAAGIQSARLEVLDGNLAALALYRKLGFEVVRTLIVWALEPTPERATAAIVDTAETVDWARAHAWIVANRQAPEPWQRADSTIMRLPALGRDPRGLLVRHDDAVTAAAVFIEKDGGVAIQQLAATDEASATAALLAAADNRQLRFHNAPADEHVSAALRALGAGAAVHQYEMCLPL